MKILYVQPGGGIGGSKISLYHMLKCAPATQTSCLVLTTPKDEGYEELVKDYVATIDYLQLPTWQKYRRSTWQDKLRAPFGNILRLLKLIRAASKIRRIIKREGIDLVHTNNSISAAGALAAWMTKKTHVWHVREPFGSKRQYRPILGDAVTYRMMQKFSKLVICNSAYTAEPFRDRQIKHIVIQNGIDLTDYPLEYAQEVSLKPEYAIKKNEIVIGMVGNLSTEWKRHNIFLDMARDLIKEPHQLKFIIFGGSSNLDQTEYTRSLAEQVNSSGLKDKVIWAEFIKDTPAMMNSVDILVHPALTEGSGRVVMEAMAAGKPVVAMNSGGVRELIQDGQTGFLIQPGNINAMVEKVNYLIKNEVFRRAMGENARVYAQNRFSSQTSMNAIVEVYHDLVRT